MTGIGVLLGGAASYVTAKLAASMISGLLFGLKITDLSPIALAAVIMVGVAIIAGLGPARRASRGDPMVALREE